MALIGYCRVSTNRQDTRLQREALKQAGVEKIFEEKASGVKADRPQLDKALAYLREGDVLVVWKLDRLACSLKHLVEIVDDLRQRGVGFKVLTGANIDTTSSGGRLVFGIFASLAEFEREMIQERVKAGLEVARAAGKHLGRPQLTEQRQAEIRGRLAAGEPWRSIARSMAVSQSTIARYAMSAAKPDGESRARKA